MNTALEESLNFFKKNYYSVSILTITIELPFIIIGNLDVLGTIPDIIGAWAAFLGVIYAFIVTPFSAGAQASLYSQIINTDNINLTNCLIESKAKLFYLVIAFFCFVIILLGGLVLFIIPGIIIGSRLSFFPFYIMYEGYKPIPALKESFLVTKDHVWKIATPVIFIFLITVLPAMILMLLFQESGILSYLVWCTFDLGSSIIGWLCVIVVFRYYCIYKNETLIN